MIKLGLMTVSYCGLWYEGKTLTLKEQIDKAKEIGFDGISIETKKPVALPCDLDKKAMKEIKEHAASQGIKIAAIETMSNFCSPIIEQRENNLCMVKEAIEFARDLEAPIAKVFAAWPGTSRFDGLGIYDIATVVDDFLAKMIPKLKRWQWAVEGIREVADWAKEYGITIALQNFPPVVELGYKTAFQMVKEINRDNVKLCLDVTLFKNQSDEYIHKAVEACKDLIVHSHYGSLWFKRKNGEIVPKPSEWLGGIVINYKAFIEELKRIGYNGFICSEECEPVLKEHRYQGIETVDEHVKMAFEFMKKLIQS